MKNPKCGIKVEVEQLRGCLPHAVPDFVFSLSVAKAIVICHIESFYIDWSFQINTLM
jgi:hypothetical protein